MSGIAEAVGGPLTLALPVAVLAGLVSFLSPCVLPLVPGYLSFVTGAAAADVERLSPRGRQRRVVPAAIPALPASQGHQSGMDPTATRPQAGVQLRARTTLGAVLFVAGFSAVFISYGAAFGGVGAQLRQHTDLLIRVFGVVSVAMGLAFVGVLPGLRRDARLRRLPTAGLAGAPLLGAVFGLGWTPCIGPTLAIVLGLATTTATAGRGALLTVAYCLGLGLPFVLAALGLSHVSRALAAARRYARSVQIFGGAGMIVVGLLQIGGVWSDVLASMQSAAAGFTPAL